MERDLTWLCLRFAKDNEMPVSIIMRKSGYTYGGLSEASSTVKVTVITRSQCIIVQEFGETDTKGGMTRTVVIKLEDIGTVQLEYPEEFQEYLKELNLTIMEEDSAE